MKSLRELYRIGTGPSSSHTMGPNFAALAFRSAIPSAARVRITLYGSLAATGHGHLTDIAVSSPFSPMPVELIWAPEQLLPRHPNGMKFEALDEAGSVVNTRIVYSVGGGALLDEEGRPDGGDNVYPLTCMQEILEQTEREGLLVWELANQYEGSEIWPYLGRSGKPCKRRSDVA